VTVAQQRPAVPAPRSLTARERQVTVLVTRGLTHQPITEALVIRKRAVEGHVERIRGKLGCSPAHKWPIQRSANAPPTRRRYGRGVYSPSSKRYSR
jgi:DNA-binding NarL/FixJ family response regulator